MKVSEKTISFDDYMAFLDDPINHDLTINHLNQILCMHGCMKLHKQPKIVILNALSSLDLTIPCHSTLYENIYAGDASLSIKEMGNDLGLLQWQECELQSVESFNSTMVIGESDQSGGGFGELCVVKKPKGKKRLSGGEVCAVKPKGKKRSPGEVCGVKAKGKKQRMKKMQKLYGDDSSSNTDRGQSSWLSL
ncbi:hypothetical protein GIB67_014761 [Kingdonia uniflora]|uniref:DUF7787 domain-containing protein n=1 Tax=Kingdonia uniflora TaxID=39325 RepID=A0A7J7NVF3_9MAGN|nr:hypothetical protein GIB67_014761 [Kingdonia uniflora]